MKINNTVYLFIYLLLLKLNFIFIKKKFIIIYKNFSFLNWKNIAKSKKLDWNGKYHK